MGRKDSGFTMLEVLLVVAIVGALAALALPSAINALQNYRLHSDAAGVAGFLNIARMKAASQYTPYALDLNATVTPPTYVIEELTSTTYNPLSPGAASYASRSPQVFDPSGTQYGSQGITFSECRPAYISVYPGTITADPSTCAGPFQFCFNTRGGPVQCAGGASPGSPLGNGGVALYVENQNGLTDAITISVGGVVQVWGWDNVGTKWYLR